MPTYDFRDTNTSEEFSKLMSIAAKEEYLAANPHIQQIHVGTGFLGIGDPVRLGLKKPDASFRDVLKNVKANNRSIKTKNTINDF
jgi:hypothetical protein